MWGDSQQKMRAKFEAQNRAMHKKPYTYLKMSEPKFKPNKNRRVREKSNSTQINMSS